MSYERVVSVRDAGRALDAVRVQLLGAGFAVRADGSTVTAQGPRLSSTKEPPLRGAGDVVASADGSSLTVRADLRGSRFLERFVLVFPFALAALLGLGLGLGVPFGRHLPEGRLAALLGPLGLALPWLVLSPLMARWIRRRTLRALDVMAENAGAA